MEVEAVYEAVYDEALRVALEDGRRQWSTIFLSAQAFVAHVLQVRVAPSDLARHGADLYLACGCARRDRVALQLFEEKVLAKIDMRILRKYRARDLGNEALQSLRIWLFVGSNPGISRYSARSSLIQWLRVVAARRAQKVARLGQASSALVGLEQAARCADETLDPERAAEQRRSRRQLQRALDASLADLPARERTLLRQHYFDGISVDDIARSIGVHRVTVARWLWASHSHLLRETQARLPVEPAARAPGLIGRDVLEALEIPRGVAIQP